MQECPICVLLSNRPQRWMTSGAVALLSLTVYLIVQELQILASMQQQLVAPYANVDGSCVQLHDTPPCLTHLHHPTASAESVRLTKRL
jgi:hypothetical protein